MPGAVRRTRWNSPSAVATVVCGSRSRRPAPTMLPAAAAAAMPVFFLFFFVLFFLFFFVLFFRSSGMA